MKLIAAPLSSGMGGTGGRVSGELRPPGDKSVSHRAFLLSALAEGECEILNPLLGEDARATLRAVSECGAEVDDSDSSRIRIRGRGGLLSPKSDLDCGNAGTLMRLLCGAAAGQNIECRLTGDESLSRRPMMRVAGPLSRMGARIETTADGTPPVVLRAHSGLRGIHFDSPVASAQVKSALLLAGLRARGETTISERHPSRDHTERMLAAFGAKVERDAKKNIARIAGGDEPLRAPENPIAVPADISSAAFFIVAAAICPGSDLLLREVGVNPTRTGVLEILREMGADIALENRREMFGEPVADIRARGGAELRGVKVGGALIASAIDEFPILLIAAACARGRTEVSGARELRVKESDRIAAMASGLSALGVESEAREDGIVLQGADGNNGAVFAEGVVDSLGDHRIAMSFAVAALRARGAVEILNADNVATSFPNFAETAREAGMSVERK